MPGLGRRSSWLSMVGLLLAGRGNRKRGHRVIIETPDEVPVYLPEIPASPGAREDDATVPELSLHPAE